MQFSADTWPGKRRRNFLTYSLPFQRDSGQFARHLPSPCYFATPCPAFYLNFHPRFPLFLSRTTIYNIFPRLPPANPLVSRNNNAQRVTKIFRFRATGNGSHVRLFRAPFSSFDITRVGSWIVHLFLLFLMRDRIGNFYRKKCNWECRITYFNL